MSARRRQPHSAGIRWSLETEMAPVALLRLYQARSPALRRIPRLPSTAQRSGRPAFELAPTTSSLWRTSSRVPPYGRHQGQLLPRPLSRPLRNSSGRQRRTRPTKPHLDRTSALNRSTATAGRRPRLQRQHSHPGPAARHPPHQVRAGRSAPHCFRPPLSPNCWTGTSRPSVNCSTNNPAPPLPAPRSSQEYEHHPQTPANAPHSCWRPTQPLPTAICPRYASASAHWRRRRTSALRATSAISSAPASTSRLTCCGPSRGEHTDISDTQGCGSRRRATATRSKRSPHFYPRNGSTPTSRS